MKGMFTCKVCGRDFALMAEEHYVSKAPTKTGILALAGGEVSIHDAFDCPHCGCQNIVGSREALYCEECELLNDLCESEEETKEDETDE